LWGRQSNSHEIAAAQQSRSLDGDPAIDCAQGRKADCILGGTRSVERDNTAEDDKAAMLHRLDRDGHVTAGEEVEVLYPFQTKAVGVDRLCRSRERRACSGARPAGNRVQFTRFASKTLIPLPEPDDAGDPRSCPVKFERVEHKEATALVCGRRSRVELGGVGVVPVVRQSAVFG